MKRGAGGKGAGVEHARAHASSKPLSGGGADPAGSFDAFSMTLAIGVLIHQAILSDWAIVSHHMLVSIAALVLLARPSSVVRLLWLLGIQLFAWLIDLPYVVNHWMLLAIAGATILACATHLLLTGADPVVRRGVLFQRFAPLLRVEILLTYGFAGLSKLNAGFFDPTLSSAVTLYGEVARKLPFVPTGAWTLQPVIWGTVILELSLPLLLLWRPTRVVGVLIALGFHFVMAIAGFTPFSAIAVPFLILFLDDDTLARGRALARRLGRPVASAFEASPLRRLDPLLLACSAWLLVAALRTWELTPPVATRLAAIRAAKGVYTVVALALGLLVLTRLCTSGRSPVPSGGFRPSPGWLAVFPIIVFLNGLSPYLGLKTESSFTMYSNLQTEGPQWNHYVLPQAVRVFSLQDELVTIVSSDDETLVESAREERRWNPFEIRRFLADHPTADGVFEYRGRRFTRETIDEAGLAGPPPLLLRKALWFRPVDPPERNVKRH